MDKTGKDQEAPGKDITTSGTEKSNVPEVSRDDLTPQGMDDYIHVTSPGTWIVLLAVIVFLFGVCIWGMNGKLESIRQMPAQVVNGTAVCYADSSTVVEIKKGMTVRIGTISGAVTDVPATPVKVANDMDHYILDQGNMQEGDWTYPVEAEVDVPDGIYEAKVVVDSVSPFSFVFSQNSE